MADHVAALRRSCLFQLRQLWIVRFSLTLEAAKTLVHAFVSSRLDYCNSLLYGIGEGLLTKLQTVLNAAAHVVTGTRKFDRVTLVLHQLHWLPVRQRITFKLVMITFKCLHGLPPSYLADVCTPVSSVVGRWQLQLANSGAHVVPRTRTRSVGGTLPWLAQQHGTASPSTCRLYHCPEINLRKNSKRIYLAASALEVS